MGERQPKCHALTQKGTSCQRPAMMGSSRCQSHQGDWSAYEANKRRTAGKKSSKKKR
jgi:hypothetical protein